MDTNFLLELVSKPIKRLNELELAVGKVEFVVLEPTIRELKRLASKPGVKAKRAGAALKYVKDLKVVDLNDKRWSADSAILYYALKFGAAVATIDQELRGRLKEEGVVVVTLRGGEVWVDR